MIQNASQQFAVFDLHYSTVELIWFGTAKSATAACEQAFQALGFQCGPLIEWGLPTDLDFEGGETAFYLVYDISEFGDGATFQVIANIGKCFIVEDCSGVFAAKWHGVKIRQHTRLSNVQCGTRKVRLFDHDF